MIDLEKNSTNGVNMANKPITFNKVTKAISNFLREQYPDCKCYLQYPESHFEMPCFVLRTSGGNVRPRIRNDKRFRGITYERFTLEFYSEDIAEIQQVGYELRILLDIVEADDGEKFLCYNKNAMTALTENHVSLTFRVHTEPYVDNEPLPQMTDLILDTHIEKNEEKT